jgi:hypothetical protein
MSVRERVLKIQNTIDDLQSEIFQLDENLNYYNILIVDQCINPMEVRLFRKDEKSGSILVASIYVNFMDEYVEQMDPTQLNEELSCLGKTNASMEQVRELSKLRKFFGI